MKKIIFVEDYQFKCLITKLAFRLLLKSLAYELSCCPHHEAEQDVSPGCSKAPLTKPHNTCMQTGPGVSRGN